MDSTVRVVFLGDAASAVRSVSTLEGRMGSLGGTAARTGKLLAGAVGVSLIGGMAKATQLAIGFDRSMRNVNSIAKVNEATFARLEKRVLALSKATGQGPKVLADGLYDIVSSGFKANEAIKILAVSAKAATAGMTDTATASGAVVAVLNAYGLKAEQASKVSSVLFKEVQLGVNTFEQLAQNLGDTVPLASQLKIPFSQVAAGLAEITKHGTSMAEASTQVSRLMADILKPSKALSVQLHSMGYETGQAAIQAHGFAPLINQLSKAAGGSADKFSSWFGNIRSLRGILNLTGPHLKEFNSFVQQMATSMRRGGDDVKAFNEQGKSISVQWDKATGALSAAGVKLGTTLFPALTTGISYLSRFAGWLDKLAGQHTIRAKLEFIGQGAESFANSLKATLFGGQQKIQVPAVLAFNMRQGGTGMEATQGLVQQLAAAVTKGIEGVDWSTAGRSISTRIGDAAKDHSKDANWMQLTRKMLQDFIPAADAFANDVERGTGQLLGEALRSAIQKAMHLKPSDVATAGLATADLIQRALSFPFRLGQSALRGAIEGFIGNSLQGVWPAARSDGLMLAHKIVDGIKAAPGFLAGLAGDLGGRLKPALSQAASDAYGWALGIGAHIAQGVLDGIGDLGGKVLGLIPGVGGGSKKPSTVGGRPNPRGGKAAGDKIDKPMISWIGEDAPRWPEWVIPSNPKYRDRALGLMAQAQGAIGIPGFAAGGGPSRGGHATAPGKKLRGRTPIKAAVGAAQSAVNALTAAQQRVSDLGRTYDQDQRAQGAVTLPPLTVDVPDDPSDPNSGTHQVVNPAGIAAATAQLNQLVTEKNGILGALEQERQRIEDAISSVQKAIDDLLAAIKVLNDKAKVEGARARSEHQQATAASNRVSAKGGLQDQVAAERAAKKPNKAKISQLEAAIKQAGRDHDAHEGNAKDAETTQGRYQKQAGDDASRVKDLRGTLGGLLSNRHDLPFDVRDQQIDLAYLQQQIAQVQGTTGTAPGAPSSSGGGSTITPGGAASSDDSMLQAMIAQLTQALGLQFAQESVIQGLPSFAGGIAYVPNDMVAQLHAGESVRTADQTAAAFRNSTGGPQPITIQLAGDFALADRVEAIVLDNPAVVANINGHLGRSADTMRRLAGPR